MSLIGQVTKVGYMSKTATVTVSRFIYHARTGKVRNQFLSLPWSGPRKQLLTLRRIFQRMERSKKYLAHDDSNRTFFATFLVACTYTTDQSFLHAQS